jgi:hypothetical protein
VLQDICPTLNLINAGEEEEKRRKRKRDKVRRSEKEKRLKETE